MADNYLSLTRNRRLELTPASITPTSWTSSNTGVSVTNGRVSTRLASGTATITASDGVNSETWAITIVPWEANRVNMELDHIFDQEYIMTYDPNTDTIYYSVRGDGNTDLYASTDGMQTGVKVSTLPHGQIISPMMITPNGYFLLATLGAMYFTKDLRAGWTLLGSVAYNGLKDAFDYYYDEANDRIYVYLGEYYTGAGSYAPKIYRGVINSDESHSFGVCLTFYSRSQYNADNTLSPVAWHIHVVRTDKATGQVYTGTGDNNNECAMLTSTNNGDNWTVIGIGDNEAYRTLAIWFTDNYTYWGMDSSNVQHIYRVPKGTTDLSLRENVATLHAGSMWYHLWIKDDLGNDVVILASSSEGLSVDKYGRVWCIKENNDGTVGVDELLLLFNSDTVNNIYLQFEPYIQDNNGYIYGNYRTNVVGQTLTRKYHLVRRGKQLLYTFVDPVFPSN